MEEKQKLIAAVVGRGTYSARPHPPSTPAAAADGEIVKERRATVFATAVQQNFLLVGESGAGKSTFARQMIPHDIASTSGSVDSETDRATKYLLKLGLGQFAHLWDTMGLLDTQKRHAQIVDDIIRIASDAAGLSGVIFLFQGKMTQQQQLLLKFVVDVFFPGSSEERKKSLKHLVIIHTHNDEWDTYGAEDLQEELEVTAGLVEVPEIVNSTWIAADFDADLPDALVEQATKIRHILKMLSKKPALRYTAEALKNSLGGLDDISDALGRFEEEKINEMKRRAKMSEEQEATERELRHNAEMEAAARRQAEELGRQQQALASARSTLAAQLT